MDGCTNTPSNTMNYFAIPPAPHRNGSTPPDAGLEMSLRTKILCKTKGWEQTLLPAVTCNWVLCFKDKLRTWILVAETCSQRNGDVTYSERQLAEVGAPSANTDLTAVCSSPLYVTQATEIENDKVRCTVANHPPRGEATALEKCHNSRMPPGHVPAHSCHATAMNSLNTTISSVCNLSLHQQSIK